MVDGREEETRSSALVGFFLAAWKRVNSYRFSVLRREGIYAAAISYTHSNAMEKNKKIKREERGTGEFRSRSPCNRSNSAAAEDRQRYFVVPIRRFPPLSWLCVACLCVCATTTNRYSTSVNEAPHQSVNKAERIDSKRRGCI
jgi:hypothetical protein